MSVNKNYSLSGIGQNIQYGKNGGKLIWNSETETFELFLDDETTSANISVADVNALSVISSSDLELYAAGDSSIYLGHDQDTLSMEILTSSTSLTKRITISGGDGSSDPLISVNGTPDDINLRISAKGTGTIQFESPADFSTVNTETISSNTTSGIDLNTAGGTQVRINHVANAVNRFGFQGSVSGSFPGMYVDGTDTNIGIGYRAKGNAPHFFYSNSGANPQFGIIGGSGAVDYLTVNGSASANPLLQAAGSSTDVNLNLSGKGTGVIRALSRLSQSTSTTITAGTTQTQGGATALTSQINYVATVANSGDGVALPTAFGGIEILIINGGTNALQVWPSTGDTIDDESVNAADPSLLAPGATRQYIALNADNWITVSSGASGGIVSVYEEFTTSGTWTKDANATFVYVEAIGGGGGGANDHVGTESGGGGGGAFNSHLFRASELSSTVSVTIGQGGAGGAGGSDNVGTNGGDTSFSTLIARGGKGGIIGGSDEIGGRGGGGENGSGNNFPAGGGYSSGGGGYGGFDGGSCVKGGAGGGGAGGGILGFSQDGGDGGSGAAAFGSAENGVSPGGGGGAGGEGVDGGGDGASGRVRVWQW
ncbi:MAG: hypothetical protein WC284_11780 [Candidimonas sp.]